MPRSVVDDQELEQDTNPLPGAGKPKEFAPQEQQLPGSEAEMTPEPVFDDPEYRAAGKLEGKVALITGGDSGIGRAVAVCYAKEGADVAIVYLCEHEDANRTKQAVEQYGRRCILIPGDVGQESFCQEAVRRTVGELGGLNLLVNNAAEQHETQSIEEISAEQLERTFRTNIYGYFFMTKAAMPHLKEGDAIINTTSVTAYRGSGHLLDYSSTKGAIVTFTRSLAQQLTSKGIRVNAVAPGPVWTPLIPASFAADKVQQFGQNSPMQRAAQPAEIAPCFVFLAAKDSIFMAGQVLHPNGGEPVES